MIYFLRHPLQYLRFRVACRAVDDAAQGDAAGCPWYFQPWTMLYVLTYWNERARIARNRPFQSDYPAPGEPHFMESK